MMVIGELHTTIHIGISKIKMMVLGELHVIIYVEIFRYQHIRSCEGQIMVIFEVSKLQQDGNKLSLHMTIMVSTHWFAS